MKISIAGLAQPQPKTDSLAAGGPSRGERDGSFAQLFRRSFGFGRSQAGASSSTQTPQDARPDAISAPVRPHGARAVLPDASASEANDIPADPVPALPAPLAATAVAPRVAIAAAARRLERLGVDDTTQPPTPVAEFRSDSAHPSPAPAAATVVAVPSMRATAISVAAGAANVAHPAAPAAAAVVAVPSAPATAISIAAGAANLAHRLARIGLDAASATPAEACLPPEYAMAATTTLVAGTEPLAPIGTDPSPAPDDAGMMVAGSRAAVHRLARIVVDSSPAPARASSADRGLAEADFSPAAAPAGGPRADHGFAPIVVHAVPASAPTRAPISAVATPRASSTAHGLAQMVPATVPVPVHGSIPLHRLDGIAANSEPTTLATRAVAVVTGLAGNSASPVPAQASTPPVAASDIAPPAAQATQASERAASVLSSFVQAAHDDSAAPHPAPPAPAGTTARAAKPALAAAQAAAPTTTPQAQSAADARAPTEPAFQLWAGARGRIGAGERGPARDGADDSSAEPIPSLAIFAPAANPATPSIHAHGLHSTPGIATAEHRPALSLGDGKPTTTDHAAPASPQPALAAHQAGQMGLRAEAQMTAALPQVPQVLLPTHAPTTTVATGTAAADLRAAIHLPAHAAPLAAQAARDDGLSMTVLAHAAHMAIASPDGDLDLHMRVRQGSAEITVAGSMAHLFDARAPEARAALAGEGLALGRFDSGQQGGGQQNQPAPEAPEASGESPTAYRPHQTGSAPAAPTDGRIHVTA